MPSELQQLQLSVDLIDNATPGLENIKKQLTQLAALSRGEGTGTRESAEYLRRLGEEAEKTAKALVPLNKGLQFAGGMMGTMALTLIPVSKQLADFANEGIKLAASSKQLGLLPGYIDSLQKQLREGGLTPEQAEKAFTGFASRLQELGQANNEARAQFIHSGGGGRDMVLLSDELIALGKTGKVREAWNLWMERLREVSRDQLAHGIPQAEVSRNATAMLEAMGLGPEALLLVDKILREPSPEELKLGDTRVQMSIEYRKQYELLIQKIEHFEEQFKTAFLPILTQFNQWLGENAGDWGNKFGDFIAATGRELAALVKLVENLADALRGIGSFLSDKGTDKYGKEWAPPSELGPMQTPSIGGVGSTAGHSEGGAMAQRSSVFLNKKLEKDTENTDQLAKLNRTLTEMLNKGGGKFGSIPVDASQLRYNQPGAPTSAASGSWSSALSDERTSKFGQELKSAAVRDKLMAYTEAEVGRGGADSQQAFIESILNRASARGQTIAKTLSGGYFDPATPRRAAGGVSEETRNAYAPMIESAMGGSNISSFATGNASGDVRFGGGPTTYTSAGMTAYSQKHPDLFGQEMDARDQRWITKMAVSSPFSLADIDRRVMDGAMGRQVASNDINTSGRLSVEVNAPNNTKVEAEGKGLFNQTEVDRRIPMAEGANQ
jgi:hypothetical protein